MNYSVIKKVVGKFKNGTPIKFWLDEFVALRSEACLFKCNGRNANIVKDFSKSQSKNIKFDEFYNCLSGAEYQKECNQYISRSPNHEMYLQKVKKYAPSTFHFMISDVIQILLKVNHGKRICMKILLVEKETKG